MAGFGHHFTVKEENSTEQENKDSNKEEKDSSTKVEEKVKKYNFELYIKEQNCNNVISKASVQSDLHGTYTRFLLQKTKFLVGDKVCDERHKFFVCLNSKENQKLFKDLMDDKEFKPYLQKEFSMDSAEADKLIKFFKHLHKKE